MDDIARIAELETENANLKARLVAAGLAPPPADLPNDEQTTKLLELVEAEYPRLAPTQQEAANHRQAFSNALHWCLFVRRSDALNSQFAASYFVDQCTAWLSRYGIVGGTNQRALCAAAVASGIGTTKFDRFPFDVELAIGLGGTSRPKAGWREVLDARAVRAPLPLDRPRQSAVEHQMLRSGDGHLRC